MSRPSTRLATQWPRVLGHVVKVADLNRVLLARFKPGDGKALRRGAVVALRADERGRRQLDIGSPVSYLTMTGLKRQKSEQPQLGTE
jgi:hypothetical protein